LTAVPGSSLKVNNPPMDDTTLIQDTVSSLSSSIKTEDSCDEIEDPYGKVKKSNKITLIRE
jgi:hypothetical protein